MKNNRIQLILYTIGGGVLQHFISKNLDYKSKINEQMSRDVRHGGIVDQLDVIEKKQDTAQNTIDQLGDQLSLMQKSYGDIINKYKDLVLKDNDLKELKSIGEDSVDNINQLDGIIESVLDENTYSKTKVIINNLSGDLDKLVKILNKYGSVDGENKFISNLPDLNLNVLYEYLDTLTLLEEAAFLHIIAFLIIIFIIVNILGALFGNEIINYFKLESKFPKLNKFFKIRAQLQKYYLMWNIFSLFFICIVGLGINLFILY